MRRKTFNANLFLAAVMASSVNINMAQMLRANAVHRQLKNSLGAAEGKGCGGDGLPCGSEGCGEGCEREGCKGDGVSCEGKDPGAVPKQEQKKEGTNKQAQKQGEGRVLPGGPRDDTGTGCEGYAPGCDGEGCGEGIGCEGEGKDCEGDGDGCDGDSVQKREQNKQARKQGNSRVLPGGPRDGTGDGYEGDGTDCDGEGKSEGCGKRIPAAKANVPWDVRETVIAAMATLPRNRKRRSSPKSKATAEFCVASLVTAQAKTVKEMVLFAMAKAKVVVEKVAAAKKGFQWYPDPAEEGGRKGRGRKERQRQEGRRVIGSAEQQQPVLSDQNG